MSRNKFAVALVLVLNLLEALVAPAVRAGDPITAAQAGAKATAESSEGREFGEAVGAAFGRDHSTTIQRCAKETRRPDLKNFDLLLRVNAVGSVEEALVTPSTNIGECVRGRLEGWKVGAPPGADAWVQVAVKLKKE